MSASPTFRNRGSSPPRTFMPPTSYSSLMQHKSLPSPSSAQPQQQPMAMASISTGASSIMQRPVAVPPSGVAIQHRLVESSKMVDHSDSARKKNFSGLVALLESPPPKAPALSQGRTWEQSTPANSYWEVSSKRPGSTMPHQDPPPRSSLRRDFPMDTRYIQTLRGLILDRQGDYIDLLKVDREARTTLGLHIGLNSGLQDMAPLQIQSVIPGGPAHLEGRIMRGDEIVAVDGLSVTESNLVTRVRGNDMTGTKCTLTLRRGREVLDVTLRRAPAERVDQVAAIFDLLDALEGTVRGGSSAEEMLRGIRRVARAVMEGEKKRCESEGDIATRLGYLAQAANAVIEQVAENNGEGGAEGKEVADEAGRLKQALQVSRGAIDRLETELALNQDVIRKLERELIAERQASERFEGQLKAKEQVSKRLEEEAESSRQVASKLGAKIVDLEVEVERLKGELEEGKYGLGQHVARADEAEAEAAKFKAEMEEVRVASGAVAEESQSEIERVNKKTKALVEQLTAELQAAKQETVAAAAKQESKQESVAAAACAADEIAANEMDEIAADEIAAAACAADEIAALRERKALMDAQDRESLRELEAIKGALHHGIFRDSQDVIALVRAANSCRVQSRETLFSLFRALGEGECSVPEAVEVLRGGLRAVRLEGEASKRKIQELELVINKVKEEVHEADRRASLLAAALEESKEQVVQKETALDVLFSETQEEILLLGKKLDEAKRRADEADKRVAEHVAEAKRLRDEMNVSDGERKGTASRLLKIEGELESTGRQRDAAVADVARARCDLKQLCAQRDSLKTNLEECEGWLQLSRQKVDKLEGVLEVNREATQKLLEASKADLDEAREMIMTLEGQKDEAREMIMKLEGQKDALGREMGSLVDERDALSASLATLRQSIAVMESEKESLSRLLGENESLVKSLNESENRFKTLQHESRALATSLSSSQNKVEILEEEKKTLAARLEGSNQRHDAAVRDADDLRRSLKVAEERQKDKEERHGECRRELENVNVQLGESSGRERGLQGLVSSLKVELESAKVECLRVAKKEEDSSTELCEYKGRLDAVNQELMEAKLRMRDEERSMAECRKHLDNVQKELDESRERERNYQRLLAEGKEELVKSRVQLGECFEKEGEWMMKLAHNRFEIDQVKRDYGEAESLVASALGECTILRAARDTARLDGKLLLAELEDFKEEVESLMNQLTIGWCQPKYASRVVAMLQAMDDCCLGRGNTRQSVSPEDVITLIEIANATPQRSMTENVAIIGAYNQLEAESGFDFN